MRTLANITILGITLLFSIAVIRRTLITDVDMVEFAANNDESNILTELLKFEERINRSLEDVRQGIQNVLENQQDPETSETYLPTVYIITPTYKRYEQIPEMTRVGQTFLNVPNLHWIVAEDAKEDNLELIALLKSMGISYTYILTPMPDMYRDPKYKAKPKGVANRNGGVDWIRKHAKEGVFYFADDDNTYDKRIFEEMRYTKKVSMFPVGFVTGYGLSTPVVKDGKFNGWYDGWIGGRKYPVDMAGFAVSVEFLLTKPKATMPFSAGYEETGFLSSLEIPVEEIEFLADNCTKIYVWHTKTQKNYQSSADILKPIYDNTNLREVQKQMRIKNATKS